MVFLHLKANEFFNYLEKHGCKQYSDDYVKDNFVVFKNDDLIIPIGLRKVYYPGYVCRVCKDFNIPIPEDFERIDKQINELIKAAHKRRNKKQ